jgi:hypothetical protein
MSATRSLINAARPRGRREPVLSCRPARVSATRLGQTGSFDNELFNCRSGPEFYPDCTVQYLEMQQLYGIIRLPSHLCSRDSQQHDAI